METQQILKQYLSTREFKNDPSFWSTTQIQNFVYRNKGQMLMAFGKELKAFLMFHEIGNLIDICYLETNPKFRRQGHMKKLIECLKHQGTIDEIWLEVHGQNHKALNLYQGLGFRQTGVRKAYYSDGGDGIGFSLLTKV